MTAEFGEERPFDLWNGYIDWSVRLARLDPGRTLANAGDLRLPIFVRSPLSWKRFRTAVETGGSLLDPMEHFLNDRANRPEGEPVEALVHARFSMKGGVVSDTWSRPDWEVLHIGAPIDVAKGKIVRDLFPEDPARVVTAPVAIGIIDDGLAFLNRRFQRPDRSTRFGALWMQAITLRETDPRGNPALRTGKVFSSHEITSLLVDSEKEGEASVYRRVNESVFRPGTPRTVERAISHGTHVLDLAAGGGEMQDVPIYAVQLPPEAFDDTSGIRLETHLVQGLRWMIAMTRLHGTPRLVVNLSLGASAGPKNGTSFVEAQLAREVRKASKTAKPVKVELVTAFGNDYRGRLSGRLKVDSQAREVGLVLARNDLTASHVEFRAVSPDGSQTLSRLRIGVQLPDGRAVPAVTLSPGMARDLRIDGQVIGRLYHVPQRPGPDVTRNTPGRVVPWLMLSLAPTALAPGGDRVPIAPSGEWRLSLRSDDTGPGDLSIQVQRDGSAIGYRVTGRQAHLVDSGAFGWDPETRDYSAPDMTSVLRRAGTNSALSTTKGTETVGAARVIFDKDGRARDARPTRDTAQGATWTGGAPKGSAEAEQSASSSGLRASGTRSGSTSRLDGTSVAAALRTRSLIKGLADLTVTPPSSRLGSRIRYRSP